MNQIGKLLELTASLAQALASAITNLSNCKKPDSSVTKRITNIEDNLTRLEGKIDGLSEQITESISVQIQAAVKSILNSM